MFALMAQGRNGGQFLVAVCATKREALAVANRIGGLKIVGPFASVVIPHARWRLCKLRKAEDGVAGRRSRVISTTGALLESGLAPCELPGEGWIRSNRRGLIV